MEFRDINEQKCGTTGINDAILYENTDAKSADVTSGNNETNLYENADAKSASMRLIESHTVEEAENDEEHYEPLRLKSKPKNKCTSCNPPEDALKKLKRVIYILSVLIIVLYITVIVLIIIVFVPKYQELERDKVGNPQVAQHDKNENVADGGWTSWGNWSTCTVTCGGGVQTRARTCANPKPSDRGNYCFGDLLQIQPCSPNRCSPITSAFSVNKPLNLSNSNGTSILTFSHTIYEHGDDFNSSTGTYTCSIPGTYHFSATLVKNGATLGADILLCSLYKSGFNLITFGVDPTDDKTGTGNAAISQSIVIHLDKGDIVYLGNCTDHSDQPSLYMEQLSSFTGFLLYPDN